MNKNQDNVQDAILLSEANTQLVSAGAGSGKTTVMIEKIANLIIDKNVPVENLLVITFTVLAANEMKERLINKLNSKLEVSLEKEKIYRLIEQIKTASIDTIDGFSSKTIKKYFYELNISPNIEIISDATRDYYLTRAMNKTIEDYLKEGNKINILLDIFGANSRNLDNLKSLIITHYENVINFENPFSYLDDCLNEYQNPIESETIVNNYICENVALMQQNIINSGSKINKIFNFYNELSKINKNLMLKSNLHSLCNLECPSISAKEIKEDGNLAELKLQLKNFFAIVDDLKTKGLDETFEEKNAVIVKYFAYFIEILKNFINNYNNLKEKNNLIDFNDLNRLMLKLLKNENVKNELTNKYSYIFVDEYQDVNPLQEALISAISNKNTHLFMVGDVKQSIYGFRGASPEGFLSKYSKFKQNKNAGSVFDMNGNYRSNPKILEFINFIFGKLMTEQTADINYERDSKIEPKLLDIDDDKVKILLVKDEKTDEFASGLYSVKNDDAKPPIDTNTKEAIAVVNEIVGLIGTKFYDAKQKLEREITYSDIAILTHSEKDEASLALIKAMKMAGIPVNKNNKLNLDESEGIKLLLSILKCITLNADDVDYLATFLSLTNLKIDDLISIRKFDASLYENFLNSENEEVKNGFKILDDIKNNSYTKTNSELIRYILNVHKLKYFLLSNPNGEKEISLIEEFLNKLTPIENNLSLNEFISVVKSNVSKSSDFATNDSENSVTLQTIHKSKGLEYPVVILFNANKQFSYLKETDSISFNADLGLGVDYFDLVNRTKCCSVNKYAIKIKNQQKGYKEELRLLYVALTRAKNKLIITGRYSELGQQKKNCFTNMILSCFNNLQEGENKLALCNIIFDDEFVLTNYENEKVREIDAKNINFEYKNSQKFNISVKNSVTGLNSKYSETKKFNTKMWLNPTMQYNADEDKALTGTYYHKALELLDLMTEYKKNSDFKDVNYKKIELAHKNLKNLVKNAKNIKKETEFMMCVPYNTLVESDVTDKVLVQGVVDLLIEYEDGFAIVDYKFSSLPAEVLKQKYAEQLKLYKQAVELAYNKPVKNTYIYSINSGELT